MDDIKFCPECGSVAVRTAYLDAEGWILSLDCETHGYIEDLDWPDEFGDWMTVAEMREAGFEVV